MIPAPSRACAVLLVGVLGLVGCGSKGEPSDVASTPASSQRTPHSEISGPQSPVVPSSVDQSGSRSPVAPTPESPSGSPEATAIASARGERTLTSSFAQLQRTLSGPVGVALVPVGGSSRGGVQLGPLQSGVAWSTAKVPLAIAARRSPGATKDVELAITASDNAAAERLWDSFGGPAVAARAVDAELRAGGDARTRTQARRVRSEYTPFGQTVWALADSAGYAASLPCRPEAAPVLRLMGQVKGNQQWGLVRLDGAAVKGGWGPSRGNGYLVRQLGVIPGAGGGQLGVAVMVDSPGGFEAGVADLDAIAGWLGKNRTSLPAGGRC